MPDKPAAEHPIDERTVRELLTQTSMFGDAAELPVRRTAEGWDCSVWRIGRDHAARFPRRALAAELIHHEAAALAAIGDRVEATGVRVPAPLFVGRPASGYPWPWSIVPWIDGTTGLAVPRAERTGWALPLARALAALHATAPDGHPVNPFRGGPLAARDEAMRERITRLRTSARLAPACLDRVEGLWAEGVAAPPWASAPVWIHGDLHPGNLVADGGALRGIIDFGDVTGGDPAYDLAIAWLAFDETGRTAFVAATEDRHDEATWTRARAWAAAVAVMLVAHSDDDPVYAALGAEALDEVSPAADS